MTWLRLKVACGARSTAVFGACGDGVAHVDAKARVLVDFVCRHLLEILCNHAYVNASTLSLQRVDAGFLFFPRMSNVCLNAFRTVILVGLASSKSLLLTRLSWRGEFRDRFATCACGHGLSVGCC